MSHVALTLPVLAVVVESGEGPFLELAFVVTMAFAVLFVYLAYLSLEAEAHSPAALRTGE